MAGSSDLVFIHPRYSDLPNSLKGTLFDPVKLKAAGLITKELIGRGTTFFFKLREQDCVLRHYWRGGIVRHLSADLYYWMGLSKTRSYREWQLLGTLENLGLPAPRRVALRIQRQGFLYRSDIVTEEIHQVTSLAEILKERPATEDEWKRVGMTIRAYHDHHIFHQDLNANNVLLGVESCHLIDFDRGRILLGAWWQNSVLNRLKRSLEKLNRNHEVFHHNSHGWSYLLDGYAISEF